MKTRTLLLSLFVISLCLSSCSFTQKTGSMKHFNKRHYKHKRVPFKKHHGKALRAEAKALEEDLKHADALRKVEEENFSFPKNRKGVKVSESKKRSKQAGTYKVEKFLHKQLKQDRRIDKIQKGILGKITRKVAPAASRRQYHSNLALWGFILSLVGFIPGICLLSLILSILGLESQRKTLALWGVIISAFWIAFMIVFLFLVTFDVK